MTIHGLLAVWKPKGCTSHDVVARVRKWTGQKRAGHTGTLDPEVEGVLPVCLGQATRLVEYMQELPKRYSAALRLGISTETEDATGRVVERKTVSTPARERVEEVFRQFLGEIEQIPPMYSAVKVGGRRLYELAREGRVVDRPARKVTVHELRLLEIVESEYPEIRFDVLCSKGTYIRTLCVDLGKALGAPAHMSSLVRTASGPFRSEDCFGFEELEEIAARGDWERAIIPLGEVLGQLPALMVSVEEAKQVFDGISLLPGEIPGESRLVRVLDETGRFLALYRWLPDGTAKPEKVFRDVE